MDFDEDDNLLVAHIRSGFIDVYAPNGGTPHQRIKCSFAKPSNIHFRKDTNTMYVYTEHENHGLCKFEWIRRGKPHYCDIQISNMHQQGRLNSIIGPREKQ